jgi:cytoskeletal protein CcmA (bactofilin family)
MNRSRFTLLALALFVAAPAFAQTPVSVEGDWDVTINSPQGANTTRVTFKQDGEKVTGLFKSPMGELPFTGTMTQDELKFAFAVNVQGMALDIAMTGKVEAETMAGKADFGGMAEGDWTAKRIVETTTSTTSITMTTTTTNTTTTTSTTTVGGFGGQWDVTLKTPAGDFPANATLTEDSGKLSGTFGSQMGEVQVNGTTEGNVMKLMMVAVTPQGNMNVTMTGDLQGDEIVNGKAEVEGMGQMEWSAKRIKQ